MPIASQRLRLMDFRIAAPPQNEGEEQQHRKRQIRRDHDIRADHQRAGQKQGDAEQRGRTLAATRLNSQ